MEIYPKCNDVRNVSFSSDDLDNIPSLEERIRILDEAEKKDIILRKSPKRLFAPIHCISDSDESDIGNGKVVRNINSTDEVDCKLPDLDDFELPDLQDLLPKNVQSEIQSKPKLNFRSISSDSDTESHFPTISKRPRKAGKQKVKDVAQEIEKEQKIKMREEKKKERELAKALKATQKVVEKSKKPEECLKNMKIIVDHNIIHQKGSQELFSSLDGGNLKYSIEENHLKMSVMWCRTVMDITVENHEVVKEEREELENILVLLISNEEFLKMVHAFVQKSKGHYSENSTLIEYIAKVKSMLPEMEITCVSVGFSKYLRDIKEGQYDSEMKTLAKQVSKTASNEVVIEVQLQAFVNFYFMDTMTEFGNLLCRFTKAIAEAPQRKEKQHQKSVAFSWFADADSSCPVKVAKDGSGLIKLWQQQIQQFQNVGPEIAEAIVSRYPSPLLLMQAYKNCKSAEEGERLLQDIVVRRNYGPLGTQRRIGPELSYKLYLFYTSMDGNQILQR